MQIKAFQIAVTSRAKTPKMVFAVEASSEPVAERRLEDDARVPDKPMFEFQRMLSAVEIEARGIKPGSVVQIS